MWSGFFRMKVLGLQTQVSAGGPSLTRWTNKNIEHPADCLNMGPAPQSLASGQQQSKAMKAEANAKEP